MDHRTVRTDSVAALSKHVYNGDEVVWEEIISEDEEICYLVVGCGLVEEEV